MIYRKIEFRLNLFFFICRMKCISGIQCSLFEMVASAQIWWIFVKTVLKRLNKALSKVFVIITVTQDNNYCLMHRSVTFDFCFAVGMKPSDITLWPWLATHASTGLTSSRQPKAIYVKVGFNRIINPTQGTTSITNISKQQDLFKD